MATSTINGQAVTVRGCIVNRHGEQKVTGKYGEVLVGSKRFAVKTKYTETQVGDFKVRAAKGGKTVFVCEGDLPAHVRESMLPKKPKASNGFGDLMKGCRELMRVAG